MNLKKLFVAAIAALSVSFYADAKYPDVDSPNGKLSVSVDCIDGKAVYSVSYRGVRLIENSPLGFVTNEGDFTEGLKLSGKQNSDDCIDMVVDNYTMFNIKKRDISYEATNDVFTFSKDGKNVFQVEFNVSNNDVAFRYRLLRHNHALSDVVKSEATGFRLPEGTTTFLCPQMGTMSGFARTTPSYETHYKADQPMGPNGDAGLGFTFPCLFKVPANGVDHWVLISETGVDGSYCASRLETHEMGLYEITYPHPSENNGHGTTGAQVSLPSYTPWRTITVGNSLAPIVETTIAWDLVSPKEEFKNADFLEAKTKFGRGSWSWIIAGDASCNFETQKKYIDFSAQMGWESVLIDALWDQTIGREKIAELAEYAASKGVALYLWYNSNGVWNDAPQSPLNRMDKPYRRRAEMQWMQSVGIRGIKVDFFGGDKQSTMELYEEILRDAHEYGLMVVFHGCTIPRGWERMYPNFVSCEAVRASENLNFSQYECDIESVSASFLPFIRNTLGNMDFGGSTLNHHYNALNKEGRGGGTRRTSDVFALSTAVLFQTPVQHFAMAPNNIEDAPAWAVDFMREVPVMWEDVKYIAGYPGSYAVLARKSGGKWYIAGINGSSKTISMEIDLAPFFSQGDKIALYSDDEKLNGKLTEVVVGKKLSLKVSMPHNGAFLIK